MAWYDDVNAVWRQVGREIGAKFEFHEVGALPVSPFEAALVRRTERWTITLEYRAERKSGYDSTIFTTTTLMKARANTEATFQFKIGRWVFSDRSIKIEGRRYHFRSNNENMVRVLLDNERIGELIREALRDSDLLLDQSQLSFKEDSIKTAKASVWDTLWGNEQWRIPISNPSRLKALFRLFEAVLDRLGQPEVQGLAKSGAAQRSEVQRS